MTRCNLIADSLIAGEPLSDGDRAHLETCADCRALASLPRLVAATATAPEPGPGFTSRITANARERLATRRRNRVLGFSLAAATAAAAAVVIVPRFDGPARTPDVAVNRPGAASDGGTATPTAPGDAASDDDELTDDELRDLLRSTSLPHALAPSADWAEIEAPLRPYRAVLVSGGTQ